MSIGNKKSHIFYLPCICRHVLYNGLLLFWDGEPTALTVPESSPEITTQGKEINRHFVWPLQHWISLNGLRHLGVGCSRVPGCQTPVDSPWMYTVYITILNRHWIALSDCNRLLQTAGADGRWWCRLPTICCSCPALKMWTLEDQTFVNCASPHVSYWCIILYPITAELSGSQWLRLPKVLHR